MKEIKVKELSDFLEIADQIESPFKFFSVNSEIAAFVHMRTFLISYYGEAGKERVELLKQHGFKEAEVTETKKISIEEII